MPAYPLGKVTEAAAIWYLKISHGFQQPLTVVVAAHQDGTKPCWSNHITLSLVNICTVFLCVSGWTCFSNFSSSRAFCDVAKHFYIERWLIIQGFTNFTAVHLVAKGHTMCSLPNLCHLYLRWHFLVIIKICGYKWGW